MSKLAYEGGTPLRTRPFPRRTPFGPADAQQVLEALDQQNLFFPTGHKVYEFEKKFSELYNVEFATTSTSGTSAVHVALGALDLEPGDEIITTPLTDMGTVAPIILQNCIPIFADINPYTCNLDPIDVESKITDRTRAIIVVHCWGQPAEMDRFVEIAKRYKLILIEDCAQAHLTHYKGQLVGTIGDVGTFSFQTTKHLQCGDGGLTITNNKEIGKRATLFIDKGCDWSSDRRYRLRYAFIAPCYRMTELQGAVLLAQLPRLPEIVKKRQELGESLRVQLLDIPGITPPGRMEGAEHSYWSFPIFIDQKILGVTSEEFGKAVAAEGIPMRGNWIGQPLYLFEALSQQITYGKSHFPFNSPYASRSISYASGLCPIAEKAMTQLRTIFVHEYYTEEDVNDVAKAIRKVAEIYLSRKPQHNVS